MPKFNRWWILKSAVFLACLVPMVWLTWDTLTGNLSANPLEDIRDRTGIYAFEPYQPGKIPVVMVHGLLSDGTPSPDRA